MFFILKKISFYLRKIEIYEKKKVFPVSYSKKFKFKIYKKFLNIKNKKILEYFEIHKNKKLRFKNNCLFLTLSLNKDLVSSGWLYKGNRWKITEIDEYINSKDKLVIFDFFTPTRFRNKGNYTKILKLICSKFKKKKIMIYTLSTNKKSKKAIIKAGFEYKETLKKL